MTCGCKGRIRAHPSAPLRDRVTQASPGALRSPPSVSTALRGHGWLGPCLTAAILFAFIFAIPALLGGI